MSSAQDDARSTIRSENHDRETHLHTVRSLSPEHVLLKLSRRSGMISISLMHVPAVAVWHLIKLGQRLRRK